jgi:hypothetical protein
VLGARFGFGGLKTQNPNLSNRQTGTASFTVFVCSLLPCCTALPKEKQPLPLLSDTILSDGNGNCVDCTQKTRGFSWGGGQLQLHPARACIYRLSISGPATRVYLAELHLTLSTVTAPAASAARTAVAV